MSTYYPGVKIESNVPADQMLYTMEVANFVDQTTIIYAIKSPKPVPSDYRIIETVSTPNDPRHYRIFIEIYRLFEENCPPKKIEEHYLPPGLAEFISPTSLDEFRPIEYKEKVEKLQDNTNTPGTCVAPLKISTPKRFFETEEFPAPTGNQPKDPSDPFALNNIESELRVRLSGVTRIDTAIKNWRERYLPFSIQDETILPAQKDTSLCGPAAYFYCLLRERPDLYRRVVKDLWEVGETQIRNLRISADEAGKPQDFFYKRNAPTDPFIAKLLGIDWITMGSLRNSENALLDYDDLGNPGSAGEGLAGMTTHWEMAEWFTKSGALNVECLASPFDSDGNSLEELVKLNEYAQKGYKIVQLLSPFYIFSNAKDTSISALHWVVWESPVINQRTHKPIDLQTNLHEFIELALFTWRWVGNFTQFRQGIYTSNITLAKFLYASRGAVVFSKIP